ncbi:LamB/YcsF family protein [Peptoniphilus raoultii]|uniref:LamB/YcsF family protein n=1 Tax=Peptoniphilus raoultii TaxID=1776387 RepID=UPI0008D8FBD1|nr:5-oxoprolinase subunit PxpA [Peptoniphilus raoultii]
MEYYVDLNSDIGESFGSYKMGMDEEVIKYVTSINCACGFHAGDPLIMDKTVKMAGEMGVRVGAHPGYPDLIGFGRRKIDVSPEEARTYMLYQVGALSAFLKSHGQRLQHMKLHGAFYNTACNDEKLANAILDAVEDYDRDLILMVLSGSLIAKEGKKRGLRVAQEVFADRGYNEDGTLVNRKLPGAFVKHPKDAIPRVIKMIKENKVTSANGKEIEIVADSICVHGDNPQAIEFVKSIRKGLEDEGIKVASVDSFLK